MWRVKPSASKAVLVAAGVAAPVVVTTAGVATAWASRPASLRRAWPMPSGARRRPGTCCSRTTWKFVPPKPKLLTAARRGRPSGAGQSMRSVATLKGLVAQSMRGFRSLTLIDGGMMPCSRARTALRTPAAPAADFRWPMLDFTEPTLIEPGGTVLSVMALNASMTLVNSTGSPTGVLVPWASRYPMVVGSTPTSS